MAQNTQPQQNRPGQTTYPGPNNPNVTPDKNKGREDLTKKQNPTQNPDMDRRQQKNASVNDLTKRSGRQEEEDEDLEEQQQTPQSKKDLNTGEDYETNIGKNKR